MHDATDSVCGSLITHLSWQERFGPKSGFGIFGRKARRVKDFTLSEPEWTALDVASGLAFLHWEGGGPRTVTNNLRSLNMICRLNATRSAKGREQKMRIHQLEALIACAEWYASVGPALQEGQLDPEGARRGRERLETTAALIPRLKQILPEVQ